MILIRELKVYWLYAVNWHFYVSKSWEQFWKHNSSSGRNIPTLGVTDYVGLKSCNVSLEQYCCRSVNICNFFPIFLQNKVLLRLENKLIHCHCYNPKPECQMCRVYYFPFLLVTCFIFSFLSSPIFFS